VKPLAQLLAETRESNIAAGRHKDALGRHLRELAAKDSVVSGGWSLPRYAAALASTIVLVAAAFTQAGLRADTTRAFAQQTSPPTITLDELIPAGLVVPSFPRYARLRDRRSPAMTQADLSHIAEVRREALRKAIEQ
jgi:hypothetical protein